MEIKWRKAILWAALLTAAAISLRAGKPKTNIISWFETDVDGDSEDELLVITGPDQSLETGAPYGDFVKLYTQYQIKNGKPVLKEEPEAVFDLSEIKPLKVQAGDINGDGVAELAVCVYKSAEFHPVPARRPFFYQMKAGKLEPVWLGSRLARPFVDYILYDVDEDGIDEIISIELLENGKKVIAVYDWKGFGFEVKTMSRELEGEAEFLTNINRREEGIMLEIGGVSVGMDLDGEEIHLTDGSGEEMGR